MYDEYILWIMSPKLESSKLKKNILSKIVGNW